MITYYGYTISPNQIETGEGFLICRNVPIARTGDQAYLGSELGLTGMDAGKPFTVRRPPEEVFSDAAIASFEGKPVTNNHPPGLIGPDDVEMYEKGHVEVVRKGDGEWEGYLLGDIHIHSRELIEAVKNGKREISCGYSCEYEKNVDGTYTQRKIRGNHIAVVERGRAGKRAAILDSKIERAATARKRGNMKHNALLRFFGIAAKDKSPEEIEQMAMDAAEAIAEGDEGASKKEKPGEEAEEKPKKEAKAESQMDESTLDAIAQRVADKLAAGQQEKTDADPVQEAIEKLSAKSETKDAPGEAEVVAAEDTGEGCGMDAALAMAVLKTMQPVVASVQDKKQRKAVADALVHCVTDGSGSGDIGRLIRASQKAAEHRIRDAAGIDIESIQSAYDAMNPHKRKEAN